jgi:multidrug transporter EmrE-like cation transporter
VNSRKIDVSVSIPIIDTAMVVVGVLGAVLFFGEPLTAKKLVGLGLLIGGMVVLAPT